MRSRFAAPIALATLFLASCLGPRVDEGKAALPRALLQYAEERSANHPALESAGRFAALVERHSDGALLVRVNEGGKFGSEESVVEQLGFGGIDLARVGLRSLAVVSPTARRLGTPGHFPSEAAMRQAIAGEGGRRLEAELESSKLVMLAWYDGGPDCRLLPRMEGRKDFGGLRVGVDSSQMAISLVVAEGGMPVPLALHDLRRALDTGLVDAVFVPLLSATSERLAESLAISPLTGSRSMEVLVASRVTFMRLLPVDRDFVRRAAAGSQLQMKESDEIRDQATAPDGGRR